MTDAILVINAGSSSIKFAGYTASGASEPEFLGKGQVEGIGTDPYFVVKDPLGDKLAEHDWPRGTKLSHADAIGHILEWTSSQAQDMRVTAAGHRVVFGGAAYTAPIRLNERIVAEVEALIPFFPLHLPHNLAAIRAMSELNPDLPQVACFDHAFHRTLPPVAQLFALPWQMTEQGIRRYGFHGLSYEYIARKVPQYAPGASKVVVAHLGSGASMCAIRDGASIESTLGFSGLDGLPMGTRTGALDPGVLLYLMQDRGMDAQAIEDLLYKRSGLLGVSGVSNDMRDLLASEDPRAEQAIELFCYHAAKNLGALAAALEGLDAIVFTAGVGENAPVIRERICRRAAWLGIHLDDTANHAGGPQISRDDSPVSAWVIPTDEERMIALHTQAILSGG
ncbi:MAG: acetate/propionate family kinase [Hyphomicrobiales bacterium]|nr:acetate/propionate family kinase [Hyphomicrobiales bacterium]